MSSLARNTIALFLLQILFMTSIDSVAQTTQVNREYLYVLHLATRLHDPKAWTEQDNALVAEHFERLHEATKQGKVIMAGRTEEPLDKTFGLVVFVAPSEEAATEFMNTDPVIASGVMTATLHPYSVALLRK
jgi:uncharacterized protein YciI